MRHSLGTAAVGAWLLIAGCLAGTACSVPSASPRESVAPSTVTRTSAPAPGPPLASSSPLPSSTTPPTASPTASTPGDAVIESPTPSTPGPAAGVPGLDWQVAVTAPDDRAAVEHATTDAGRIGLMAMDPATLSFRFIPGVQIPEGSPRLPADRSPASWMTGLAAAFNGGFHLRDNAGGYYYAQRTIKPLRPGLASIVVRTDGSLHVTTWTSTDAPDPGVAAVRQNLKPLVRDGVSTVRPSDTNATWGLADDGLAHANRSALGERTDGSLVFAYGAEVTARELADALVAAGVHTAAILDMNKSWPTGFFYTDSPERAKVTGHKIHSGIYRPPSTYFSQFTKDFFVANLRGVDAAVATTAPTVSASPAADSFTTPLR